MNVMIEIGHPAHVHFFRRVIEELKSRKEKVILVTRNKEITNLLLDQLRIPYISISKPASGKFGLFAELLKRWFVIWRIIGCEKIDVVASISGISTAVPAKLRRVPNLTITDTEDATISNYISFPFSDCILTPQFFLKDLGKKQLRYFGLHETAYLRVFDFRGLEERLAVLGLKTHYSVVRLIAYDAAHDWRLTASTEQDILKAIEYLRGLGQVFITSQKPLDGELKKYELKIPITQIHEVLAGARIFVGESPTMAVEAGLLGTPSFLVSPRYPNLGNMMRLEERGLLRNLMTWQEVLPILRVIEDPDEQKSEWSLRARKFLDSTVDVSKHVIGLIEELARGDSNAFYSQKG